MLFIGIPLQILTALPDLKHLGKSKDDQKQKISWSPFGIGITDIFIGFAELSISPSLAIDSFISSLLDFGMVSTQFRDLCNRLHLSQFLTYLGLAVRADSKLEEELMKKKTFGEKLKFELKQYRSFPSRIIKGLRESSDWLPKLIKSPKEFLPRISSNLLFVKALIGPIAGLSLLTSYLLKKILVKDKNNSPKDNKARESQLINSLEHFGWFVAKSLYWLMTFSWLTKAFNPSYSLTMKISSFVTGLFEGMHTVFLSNPFLANFFRTLSRVCRTSSFFLEQQNQLLKSPVN